MRKIRDYNEILKRNYRKKIKNKLKQTLNKNMKMIFNKNQIRNIGSKSKMTVIKKFRRLNICTV